MTLPTVPIRVLFAEQVASGAMSFQRSVQAAPHIHKVRHSFEVVGVNASPGAAEVIEFEPVGDRSFDHFEKLR